MTLNPIPKQGLNWVCLRLNHKGLNLPKEEQFGLIAQDVEKVIPNMVKNLVKPAEYDSSGNVLSPAYGFMAVNYQSLIPVTVSAIQELEAELSALKAEVAKLKEENYGLIVKNTEKFVLEQNIPNPFNELTTIKFKVPEGSKSVKLLLTDLNGTLIKSISSEQTEGNFEVAKGTLKPGIYLYSLSVNGELILSKKLIVE